MAAGRAWKADNNHRIRGSGTATAAVGVPTRSGKEIGALIPGGPTGRRSNTASARKGRRETLSSRRSRKSLRPVVLRKAENARASNAKDVKAEAAGAGAAGVTATINVRNRAGSSRIAADSTRSVADSSPITTINNTTMANGSSIAAMSNTTTANSSSSALRKWSAANRSRPCRRRNPSRHRSRRVPPPSSKDPRPLLS